LKGRLTSFNEDEQLLKYEAELEVLSPVKTSKSVYLRELQQSGIKGSTTYWLDWTYIFSHIDRYVRERGTRHCVILDIGCGNSMFHTFLEKRYANGIIGIDRHDSTVTRESLEKNGHTVTNATDFCLDFIQEGAQKFRGIADIIFWNSSIEHNNRDAMVQATKVSLECLKDGGMFLATWAFGENTHWNEEAQATVLGIVDAEDTFSGSWVKVPDFQRIVSEYRSNVLGLDDWHEKRFGSPIYEYVHAGCKSVKD
jgi:SAM-dependent methyltransferase